MKHGVPTVCVPNGVGQCVKPFLDPNGVDDSGGAHGPLAGKQDVDGGRMDGFVRVTDRKLIRECRRHRAQLGVRASPPPERLELPRRDQIPNYWAYARNFVLQDHMFEPNWGWSLPAHLWLVSGWSAQCRNPYRASTCTTNLSTANGPSAPLRRYPHGPLYGWTDLTYLLHKYKVTWASYVEKGAAPDCLTGPIECYTRLKGTSTPGFLGSARRLHRRPPGPPERSLAGAALALLLRGRARAAAERLVGDAGLGRQQPPRRPDRPGPGVGDEARQRGDEGARSGRARRSSSPGTTGAASTTTSGRRASTPAATGCACRRS